MKDENIVKGVVYKKDGGKHLVLLVLTHLRDFDNQEMWTFPKMINAAIEGLKTEMPKPLGGLTYPDTLEGKKIHTFYALKYISGDIQQTKDLMKSKWLEVGEAEKVLTYVSDKVALEEFKKLNYT